MRPIELTLYDPETNEVVNTYVQSYVPWGILKRALAMRDVMSGGEVDDQTLDQMAALVVAAFNDKFTFEQVSSGADAGEMFAVLQAIMARASHFTVGDRENPTPAAGK